MGSGLLHEDLTSGIIGAYYHVYNDIGNGFVEPVYQRALVVAFQLRGLHCEREVPFLVHFEGVEVGRYRADIVVEGRIIVEVKCAEHIGKAHTIQTLNYLKASSLSVGLILNFGSTPSFKRVVL
jgi:GxxExxY protein